MYKLTAYPLDKSSTLRYTPSTQEIILKRKSTVPLLGKMAFVCSLSPDRLLCGSETGSGEGD